MESKKIKIFSTALLLALATMSAACSGTPGSSSSASESNSEEPSSSSVSSEESSQPSSESSSSSEADPDEGISGRFTVDKNMPTDIMVGEDNCLDLDQYVQVTKVSKWRVESDSDTIRIEGHKIIGVDFGPFIATMIAGTTRRAVVGNVITREKAAFNEAIAKINLQYEYSTAMTGSGLVNKNYWYEVSDSDETTGAITFAGGITAPGADRTQAFTLDASVVGTGENQEIVYANSIETQPGYGLSVEGKGYVTPTWKASDWTQQFDKDGDPTGYFIFENSEAAEDYSSDASIAIDGLVGSEIWTDMVYYLTGSSSTTMNLAAVYADGEFTFYPCVAATGRVRRTMTVEGSSYSTGVKISAIGEATSPACDAWLAAPTDPTVLDVSPISAFYENLFTAKSYTKEFYGTWYNPQTGEAVACPANMTFSNTKEEVFTTFEAATYVNENIVEQTVTSVGENCAFFSDPGLPAAGTRAAYFVYNNHAHTLSGDAEGYGEPKVSESEFSKDGTGTIWDSSLVPYIMVDEETDLLGKSSFYAVETLEDGSTAYLYNTNGPDQNLGYNSYYCGLPYLCSEDAPFSIADFSFLYLKYTGWIDQYCTIGFILDENSLTFQVDFAYNKSAHYMIGWTISGVGVDNVSAAAKAAYNAVVNPEESSSSEESSTEASSTEETSSAESSAE